MQLTVDIYDLEKFAQVSHLLMSNFYCITENGMYLPIGQVFTKILMLQEFLLHC